MKKLIIKLINKFGYTIEKTKHSKLLLENEFIMEKEFLSILELCKPYTMTSLERMYTLYQSVKYIIDNNIEGDFVECGVWKGGSSMLITKYLALHNIIDRKIYMYDTFDGMSAPTDNDISIIGSTAKEQLSSQDKENDKSIWCYSPLNEVENNIMKTGFALENVVMIKGKVEDTIPNNLPKKIALLRLDTDWYESTKHELLHLYPLLMKKGVLIIDDYGHWQGCRKAVDEYFVNNTQLLIRIDYTGRVMTKN